ncbi:MAG: phenylalanine--tRNA ligase subunit beta [Saprospiraceae bacterium]|nr:phenylalanine--tRNA ligase subunit beta [Saprospiraceae bacterium]
MKVSLNWLKSYMSLDLEPEKIGEILTDIGLEVEGMEQIESIPGGLQGLVVGLVTECGKHPDADRLSLTRVDVGTGEPVQIVCGAPNVAAGQKVIVATVGTMLYPTEGEPFKIKKGKIRGEVSEGMICAEDEIGLGTSHAGIMILPDELKIGTPAAKVFKLENDVVYDIGLTPNRSDATCHIGVAQDLAAYLKVNMPGAGVLRLPKIEEIKAQSNDLAVEVIVENTEACPRYAGVSLDNIQVGESPDWLKNRLKAIDVRPINNVVDITNYVLHEYGQPLHAFDLDAIAGRTIRVKTLEEGSPFVTLDEVERKLSAEDLMICDGNSVGLCMAGVFGGIGSGVTNETKRIFLESAHFSAKYIRRTSMRHILRTDAAKVFEKGSDPNVAVDALKRAVQLLKEIAGATVASAGVDLYPVPVEPVEIETTYSYVNRLIGVEIPQSEIHQILAAMDMALLDDDGETFRVAIPTNKSDVTRPADLVEEILRIYGLNRVPMPSRISSTPSFDKYPSKRELQESIANMLAANGFSEMLALSLSESRFYRDILPMDADSLVYINNTSNVHLDIMRPDLFFSALQVVKHNQNRQQADLKLFEFGRSYHRMGEGEFKEQEHLTLCLTGRRYAESWLQKEHPDTDYYSLRAAVLLILERLGISGFQQTVLKDEPFSYGLKYHRGPKELVSFGQIHPALQRGMDIRQPVYFADFNWELLVQSAGQANFQFQELSKYPSTRRDLALLVDNSVKFDDIVAIARKQGKKILRDINLFDVFEDAERLGAGKKSYAVSFVFENPERTLQDVEIDQVMNKMIGEYEKQLQAQIRR